MKKTVIIVLVAILLTGCVKKIDEEQKISDAAYTVVPAEEIPDEFAVKIKEAQEEAFYLTYADQGYLYIARGYGTQPTSGYSISVTELYDTENTICFHTSLIGPKQSESVKEVESFPYIVVKMEYMDKKVMFES